MKGRQAGGRRRRTPRLISPFLRRSMPARPISIVVACVGMRCPWVGCWFLSLDVVSGVGVEVELVSLEVQLKPHPTRSPDFLTFFSPTHALQSACPSSSRLQASGSRLRQATWPRSASSSRHSRCVLAASLSPSPKLLLLQDLLGSATGYFADVTDLTDLFCLCAPAFAHSVRSAIPYGPGHVGGRSRNCSCVLAHALATFQTRLLTPSSPAGRPC